MISRISEKLFGWGIRHKERLVFMSGIMVARVVSSTAFGVLPVIIAASYGDWASGALMSALSLLQAFLFDPIAGMIADRYGGKRAVVLGTAATLAAGVWWVFVPLDHWMSLLVFSIILYMSYALRAESSVYYLRMSARDEGGIIFGLAQNTSSIATFFSSLLVPVFVVASMHHAAAVLLAASAAFSLVMIAGLPSDRYFNRRKNDTAGMVANPLATIRVGYRFMRRNGWFPSFAFGSALFEGVFYGTLWFVVPLHLAASGAGIAEGMMLGIFELVAILFGALSGYAADKVGWRKVIVLGWTSIAAGAVLYLLREDTLWLVAVGALIGFGDTIAISAAGHALEAGDDDHDHDGAFIGFANMATDIGYGIAPVVGGVLYGTWGFSAAFGFAAAVVVLLAVAMIFLARRLA